MDNKPEFEDVDWTEVNSSPESQKSEPQEEAAHEYDSDWPEKSKAEIKAGVKQITDALRYAFEEGKNDPKLKQFGEDVKSAFDKIGKDISDLFN